MGLEKLEANTELYVVCAIQAQQGAEIGGMEFQQKLKLTWADGMVGVLPVFTDKGLAEKYADNKFEIIHVRTLDKGIDNGA